MSIAVRRNVAVYQPSKPLPRQVVPLATPLQHAPPCPTDFAAKAAQPIFVSGYTKVVEVTLHHLAQPFSDLGNRMVHLASQLLPDRLQRRSHPLLHRQTQDFEPTLAGLATAVHSVPLLQRGKRSAKRAGVVGRWYLAGEFFSTCIVTLGVELGGTIRCKHSQLVLSIILTRND